MYKVRREVKLCNLSPCHLVTLSPHHLVTLSPCHLVTPVTLVTLSPCHPYHLATLAGGLPLSPCHLVTLSPLSPCHLFFLVLFFSGLRFAFVTSSFCPPVPTVLFIFVSACCWHVSSSPLPPLSPLSPCHLVTFFFFSFSGGL